MDGQNGPVSNNQSFSGMFVRPRCLHRSILRLLVSPNVCFLFYLPWDLIQAGVVFLLTRSRAEFVCHLQLMFVFAKPNSVRQTAKRLIFDLASKRHRETRKLSLKNSTRKV